MQNVGEKSRIAAIVLAVAALVVGGIDAPPAPAVGAPSVTVLVDGQAVRFDQPPAVIGGRVLIPLRSVFERLGASVDWNPDRREVLARSGDTVVVLGVGLTTARVNDRVVALDVPAMILGGRTLVPLRFISEALGASVDWDPASRTVLVQSPQRPAAAPPPPPPRTVPPPPPAAPVPPPPPAPTPGMPQINQFEGTVVRVQPSASPPRLWVRADGMIWNLFVSPVTVIFLTDAGTGRGGSASLDQIRRGDLVRVTAEPSGHAQEIRATYREIPARLSGISGLTLFLIGGQTLRLAEDALLLMDGREVTPDLLQSGMEVTLRVHPRTGEVWEVRGRAPTAPPVPMPRPAGPRIDRVSLSSTGPLGIGATLEVIAFGTPDGRASFDIEGIEGDLRMDEGPPGRYIGRYRVRRGDATRQGDVSVRLQIRGLEASRTVGEVVIDGLPPEITRRMPEPGATIPETRPTVTLGFVDRGPAGIRSDGVRLWVNGREVRMTSFSDRAATFSPPEVLPAGVVRVQARVTDLAGNETTTAWTFTVAAPLPPTAPATPAPAPVVTPVPPIAPTTPSSPGPPTDVRRPASPVITAPKPGDRVVLPLVVRGTAPAGLRVEVTVGLRPLQGPQEVTTEPTTAQVTADGAWEIRLQFPPGLMRGGGLTITAVTVGPGGARSEPAKLVLVWRPGGEFERP